MRIYRPKNNAYQVVTGKIKSISENRQTMVIDTMTTEKTKGEDGKDVYNRVPAAVEITPKGGVPFAENLKVGYTVTAVGIGNDKEMTSKSVFGAGSFEMDDVSVVAGFVKFAGWNEEKNQDGTPRLNKKGEPKKRHFDVTISVKDDVNNRYVDHVIQEYPYKDNDSRFEKLLGKFDYKENKGEYFATVVTAPAGEVITKQNDNFTNYRTYHLGVHSIDLDIKKEKEKTNETPAKNEEAKAAEGFNEIVNPEQEDDFEANFT